MHCCLFICVVSVVAPVTRQSREYSVTVAKLNCKKKSLRCYSERQSAYNLFEVTNLVYMKQQIEELSVKVLVTSKYESSVQDDEPEPERKDLHKSEKNAFSRILKVI